LKLVFDFQISQLTQLCANLKRPEGPVVNSHVRQGVAMTKRLAEAREGRHLLYVVSHLRGWSYHEQ